MEKVLARSGDASIKAGYVRANVLRRYGIDIQLG